MSRKSIIMFGMVVGSIAGGYLPDLWGADFFSVTALLTSTLGGVLGIWVAYVMTR
jgi:hypothetical protein